MSKKKKVTRGNPAASVAIKEPRGGWKPSTGLGNTATTAKPALKEVPRRKSNKLNWKQLAAVLVVLFIGAALILSTLAVPSPQPEAPAPYNPQPITQGSTG